MKIQIKEEDLTAALARNWSSTNCLVAQAIMRATEKKVVELGVEEGMFEDGVEFLVINGRNAQYEFDKYHGPSSDMKGDVVQLDRVRRFIGHEIEIGGAAVAQLENKS